MKSAQEPGAGSRGAITDSPWFFPLVAVLLTAAGYARAPWLGFVYDDDVIIRANPYITSASNIPAYFTQHVWTGLMLARNNYYRPVFLLWLLAAYKAFGTNPLGWHLSSLLLHLGSTAMVYQLTLRMARSRWAALGAALLFGLHPVQVENVAWSSAVTELLCTFFALAAFLAYLAALDSLGQRGMLLTASVFLYALAMLSKETAIVLPAIVFLHEWLGRPGCAAAAGARRGGTAVIGAIKEALPFAFVALAYLAARIAVLGAIGETTAKLGTRVWLQSIPKVLAIYLGHLTWPAGLSVFYDYSYVDEFSMASVLLPAALIVLVGALLLTAGRKSPAALVAGAWMTLAILPVLDLPVFPRGEFLHDRYLYQPMIGLALLAGIGIGSLEGRWPGRGPRFALFAGCAVVAAALGATTFAQTRYWVDNFSLYSRGVSVAPRNGPANMDLGSVLINRGQLDEGMALLRKAVEYTPNLYLAHYDLGIGYFQTGHYGDAEASFRRAQAIMPQFADAGFFLGMTYLRAGRLPEAAECMRKAIALRPENVDYRFGLAMALQQMGDMAAARGQLQEALRIDPAYQPARTQLQKMDATASRPPAP